MKTQTSTRSYKFVNSGREADLYRPSGRRVIHKFWRQDWILINYSMYDSKGQLFKRARQRAARRFVADDLHDVSRITELNIPHHGIPIDKFRMVTFVLSKAAEDIINRARKAGIPTSRISRTILHPNKPLYVLELSDFTRKGHDIIAGNEMPRYIEHSRIVNHADILNGIKEDKEKLRQLGYLEDDAHPENSTWLIRINRKTGRAERFLWDTTNLKQK